MGGGGHLPPAIRNPKEHGDWREMSAEDQRANEEVMDGSLRVFSRFTVNGVRLWIITEAERSSTTILLPKEY